MTRVKAWLAVLAAVLLVAEFVWALALVIALALAPLGSALTLH